MQIGVVGLGKMGSSVALQASEKGIEVWGLSREVLGAEALKKAGVRIVTEVSQLVGSLQAPRTIFIYVPAGRAIDLVIDSLVPRLAPGDVIVDAGNSHFRDSMARQRRLAERGVGFVDCGSSGGPEGARTGACFMVGGRKQDVSQVEPVLKALSVSEGYLHVGPPGSGHFTKLIHNAIEFGMLQAIGEGVALLKASEFSLDLPALFHNWAHGSVIRGWLVELMEQGLRENPDLARIPSYVEDTGEVNWALEEAVRLEIPIPVISQSVFELFASRDSKKVSQKSVALLRHGFGGHPFGPDEAIAHEREFGKVGLELPSEEDPGQAA